MSNKQIECDVLSDQNRKIPPKQSILSSPREVILSQSPSHTSKDALTTKSSTPKHEGGKGLPVTPCTAFILSQSPSHTSKDSRKKKSSTPKRQGGKGLPVTPCTAARKASRSSKPSPTSEKAALALSALFGSSSKSSSVSNSQSDDDVCTRLSSPHFSRSPSLTSSGGLSMSERLAAAAMIGGVESDISRGGKRSFSDVGNSTTPETGPSSRAKKSLSSSTYSRKDKSLGLLCEKFMSRYGEMEMVDDSEGISIDAAAKALEVERRRIYDIINILESIEIVRRKCKNTYIWHGKVRLCFVLAELQQQAFLMWPEDVKSNGLSMKAFKGARSIPFPDNDSSKDKSLGRLSQKFIQMFLVGNKVLSLSEASEKILGSAANSPNEEKGMKTKVRRLYDIANVMVSIGIIQKVTVDKSKKPSFMWDCIPPDRLPEFLQTVPFAGNKEKQLFRKKGSPSTPVQISSCSNTSAALKAMQTTARSTPNSPITKCKLQSDENVVQIGLN